MVMTEVTLAPQSVTRQSSNIPLVSPLYLSDTAATARNQHSLTSREYRGCWNIPQYSNDIPGRVLCKLMVIYIEDYLRIYFCLPPICLNLLLRFAPARNHHLVNARKAAQMYGLKGILTDRTGTKSQNVSCMMPWSCTQHLVVFIMYKLDPVGSTVRYEMMKLCTG